MKNTDFSINDFLNEIYKLIEELKIPKTLNEVGVSQSDIPKLAGDAIKQERLLVNNPVKIEYNDAVDIYKATL